MTKKSFVYLLLTVLGGLMFALGICMCLLPEWNTFTPGVAVTALGALTLLVLALIRWIQAGRPMMKIDWNKTGKVAYAVLACLVLGTGMALILTAENMMLPGIGVGVAGILMLVGCIPVFKGLK